ncbi:MAG: flagellar biosynthetic protein FliR [Myxococcota bacterium]
MGPEVAAFACSFARVAAWAGAAPVIGTPMVPPRVRVALAGAVALVLATVRTPIPEERFFAVLPTDILLGLVAGFASRLALAGLEAAGQLIGMLLGIGFASFFDPASGDEALPTRRIATYLAALAFLGADGLEHSIRALAILPAEPELLSAGVRHILEASGTVMIVSIRAAAPLALAALVSNLTVALASRAAPALNAFSVMLAFFLLTGLGVLLVTGPAFMAELQHAAAVSVRAAAEAFAR